jgi:hypothetical protein
MRLKLSAILIAILLTAGFIQPKYFSQQRLAHAQKTVFTGLLCDFENGNLQDVLGGEWQVESDEPNQGDSQGALSLVPGRPGSKYSMKFDYKLGPGFQYRYCCADIEYPNSQDFSKFKGIRFWIKGTDNKLRLNVINDSDLGYDYYGYVIDSVPQEWQQVTVPFISLKQEGWGKRLPFSAARILKLEFRASSQKLNEKGSFLIDDVELYGSGTDVAEEVAKPNQKLGRPTGDEFVLADFEGTLNDRLGAPWTSQNDSGNGGASIATVKLVPEGFGGSKGSLRLDYTLAREFQYRYTIAKVEYDSPVDMSAYKSVVFRMRGSGNSVKVHVVSPNVTDYDYHETQIRKTTYEWKEYKIPFSEFVQEGWGANRELDLSRIVKIQFQTGSMVDGEKGWFEVDNIVLSKSGESSLPKFRNFDVVSKDTVDDGCSLAIFGPGYAENPEKVRDVEKKIGKKFASVMWFLDWSKDFPVDICRNLYSRGYIPHICWEAWIKGDMASMNLDTILSGAMDDYIRKFADGAKQYGKPLMLRWGHEFNGNWYPWSIPRNGMDGDKYVRAFRYIHDMFVKQGALNVLWLWCPQMGSVPPDPRNDMMKGYPGDAYVDWIAVDGYNFGNAPGFNYGWNSFDDIYNNYYRKLVKSIPGKPLMIGEFASGDVGGDKEAWIRQCGQDLKNRFPAIKLITWFNINKETDWRIDADPAIAQAFHDAVADNYFTTSPIQIITAPASFSKNYKQYQDAALNLNKFRIKSTLSIGKINGRANLDEKPETWSTGLGTAALQTLDQVFAGKDKWKNTKDLSANVSIGWETGALVIAADITDGNPAVNKSSDLDIWRGDCLELSLGTDPGADPERTDYMAGDYQFGISPGDASTGKKPFIWNFKNQTRIPGDVKVVKKDYGYLLIARIPFKAFGDFKPEAGKKYGFDLGIDEAGPDGQRLFQMVWFGNDNFYRNPSVWNDIEFVE